MVKAVFYIPENFNDNSPIPEEQFLELQEFLVAEFGGYTQAGRVEGAWTNPRTGEVSRDVSFKYEVALPAERIAILKSYLVELKNKIRQDAICFELDTGAEIEML